MPRARSLMVFFRSLSLLVQSGVPFHRGLDLLARQSEDEQMGRVCQELLRDLLTGKTLSQSMAEQPRAFTSFQIRLIQVGERTGRLDLLLARLAEHEERNYEIRLKVRGAITYPALVFGITLMLLLAPSMLFRGIFPLLKSQGQSLPWLTQAVMFVAESLARPQVILLLLIALACGLGLLASARKEPVLLCRIYGWADRQVALGRMLRMLATSRFASSLSLQLDAGMPLLDALRLAAHSSAHPLLARDIEFACQALTRGLPLDVSLQQLDFFPDSFLSVLKAGQESGSLPLLLVRLSRLYDLELEAALDCLVALLEPMVMLVMGLVVAVVVISLMLPMVQLVQGI